MFKHFFSTLISFIVSSKVLRHLFPSCDKAKHTVTERESWQLERGGIRI